MSNQTNRSQVVANIWRGIARSGVDLSSLSESAQQALVSEIADAVANDLASSANRELASQADTLESVEEERLLWKGRPLLSLQESYQITSERIKIVSGLLSRHVENYELIRVQDIDYKQGLFERLLGIGDITIQGQDASEPVITLRNIGQPERVYEVLRRAWLAARKRHGLQFREYM
jgi:hypothetical protein